MNNVIDSIIIKRYPRALLSHNSSAVRALNELDKYTSSAISRGIKTFNALDYMCKISLNDLPNERSFINILNPASRPDCKWNPFIGTSNTFFAYSPKISDYHAFPSSLCKMKLECYPFHGDEQSKIKDLFIELNPFLGETKFLYKKEIEWKLSLEDWNNWADAEREDDREIYTEIHKSILDEIPCMKLSDNDLICDVACGFGDLIGKISKRFPEFMNIFGSDLNKELYKKAKTANPSLRIFNEDAQSLSYLDLNSVSLFIFCGLLNNRVITKEEGLTILKTAISKAKDYTYFIITGKTASLFDSKELQDLGLYPLKVSKWPFLIHEPFYLCLGPKKT